MQWRHYLVIKLCLQFLRTLLLEDKSWSTIILIRIFWEFPLGISVRNSTKLNSRYNHNWMYVYIHKLVYQFIFITFTSFRNCSRVNCHTWPSCSQWSSYNRCLTLLHLLNILPIDVWPTCTQWTTAWSDPSWFPWCQGPLSLWSSPWLFPGPAGTHSHGFPVWCASWPLSSEPRPEGCS